VDFLEAAETVLREEGRPLHWTVVQDLALRRGHLDPFTQPEIRKNVLAALNEGARTGRIRKEGNGVYSVPLPG
jgi:hypothetical protein